MGNAKPRLISQNCAGCARTCIIDRVSRIDQASLTVSHKEAQTECSIFINGL